jgi:hypothetical protein
MGADTPKGYVNFNGYSDHYFDYLAFKKGEIIVNSPIPEGFLCKTSRFDALLDFPGNSLGWLIVSKKAYNLLKSIMQCYAQFFPIPVEENGVIKGEFYLINLTKHFDCVDIKSSEPFYNRRGILERFQHLTFDQDKIPREIDAFRYDITSTDISNMPVFSDRLRKLIKANGLLGFSFIKIRNSQSRTKKGKTERKQGDVC